VVVAGTAAHNTAEELTDVLTKRVLDVYVLLTVMQGIVINDYLSFFKPFKVNLIFKQKLHTSNFFVWHQKQ
jgi:hypothetical protein